MKHFIKIKEGLKYFHILILTRYLIIRYNNTSWILNDDWERNIARRAKIAKRRGCFYQKEKDSIGKYTWNHRVGQSGMDAIYLYHLWASSSFLFATASSMSLHWFGTSRYSITSGLQCKSTNTFMLWQGTLYQQQQCEMDAFWISGKSLEYVKAGKSYCNQKMIRMTIFAFLVFI